MTTSPDTNLKQLEKEIEAALHNYEEKEQLDAALEIYRNVEKKLSELNLLESDPSYQASQAVLAYCLMRQANIVRQQVHSGEAFEISRREIAAARASGNSLTLARSLLSYGIATIVNGDLEQGVRCVQEAHSLFEKGQGPDFQQGLGWYWIMRADLANAHIVPADPEQVIDAANEALDILLPIKNWEGVTRAYATRAVAYDTLGAKDAAERDRQSQARYLKLIDKRDFKIG